MNLTDTQERTLRKAKRCHDCGSLYRPYALEVRSAASLSVRGMMNRSGNTYYITYAGLQWLAEKDGDACAS